MRGGSCAGRAGVTERARTSVSGCSGEQARHGKGFGGLVSETELKPVWRDPEGPEGMGTQAEIDFLVKGVRRAPAHQWPGPTRPC